MTCQGAESCTDAFAVRSANLPSRVRRLLFPENFLNIPYFFLCLSRHFFARSAGFEVGVISGFAGLFFDFAFRLLKPTLEFVFCT